MQDSSFVWNHLGKQHRAVDKWVDGIWLIILFLAAVLLFCINLGGTPLQDGDEGILAQVARQISHFPIGSIHWLFPTTFSHFGYRNPPLIPWLIAGAYSLGGVSELTTRLPSALLTATSIPLLYCIGKEIFRQRYAAIYSALAYLTTLPVVLYGRLAILDGAVVSFLLVMVLCTLRSRRNCYYCLGIGISFGLICLTQGWMGISCGAIVLLFLFWDTPRLLNSYYFWTGIFIGCLPVVLWYTGSSLHNAYSFEDIFTINQSSEQINTIHSQLGIPWYYMLEVIKLNWPWFIFVPQVLRLIWQNYNLSWAKLIMVWGGVYVVLISLININLPWSLLPIYPCLALALGYQLAETQNTPLYSLYPRVWVTSLAIIAIIATVFSTYFSWGNIAKADLQIIFIVVALTMTISAILAERGDAQFIKILVWGSYISLLLLVKSHYWVWELDVAYPVKPVAMMVGQVNLPIEQIYTSFPYLRSSLDFYSSHTIIPASPQELQYYWQYKKQPYFLLNTTALNSLQLRYVKVINQAEGWQLVTKDEDRV